MNRTIRVREVRLIGPDGEQLGILPTREALRIAQEQNLDLVEVAPQARPPVCRIMDYGRFKYEQSKRDKEARKKQKLVTIKELKMSPNIDEHDLQVKLRNAERFLKEGDKVKMSVRFRGREIVHAELTRVQLLQVAKQLEPFGSIEQHPRVEGRQMVMVITPKT
ncbi:MAG TPA: translation initiation factor IF-3 [Limnochordia bacterium]